MATSSEIRNQIKEKLVRRAAIQSAEGLANVLDDLVDLALLKHRSSTEGDFTALALIEHEAVLLLAWIEVCFTRASSAAPQPSLALRNNAPGFGADRDTPFTKCMKLAEKLKEHYDKFCSDVGIGEYLDADGDVTVGSLYRKGDDGAARAPVTDAPALPVPTLRFTVDAGAVIVQWDAVESDMFEEAIIVESSVAGIYQPWNQKTSSGIPRIADFATVIYRTTDRGINAVKVEAAPATYYFLLILKDRNGNLSYSSEVSATVV